MHNQPEIIYDKQGNAHVIVDYNDDYIGAKLGFWLFLFTEMMIFGSMFLIYAFYMFQFSDTFVQYSATLNVKMGGTNTFILLVSALTMGLSLVRLRQGNVEGAKKFIWATIVLALIFLSIKYFEWSAEIHHGIYPGSPTLKSMGDGAVMFFGLYFVITGLHGIHIILGIGAMIWVLGLVRKGKITPTKFVVLENTALYWDLVHLVWVFVFPLFYLIH
ncbi:MAG: cytochrome c oxidase subunit 3 [Sulfurospirillaceae bacterium]|jgi:cytochrome c oxidase subunit 3|nr:cytochrome c oxidase subunit 3 [Sulfurospirillaceae bacterium]MDD2826481.1 cytochrome c oxidase subunit 3 [Sulfurospirillaceae bacterium]